MILMWLEHWTGWTYQTGATYVTGTVSKALGHDISSMTLSRSSIGRSRCRNREKQASVEQEFIHITPLLLHWDGKLLPNITGSKETVDRIAVLVTAGGGVMLLGVPKIGRCTGKQQAEACLTTLDEWGIHQQICGLVFLIHWTTRWLGWLECITSWSWCWPVSFGHSLGQLEGQMLHCSKGFRLAGRILTSLHMRLLLRTCLIYVLLFFELRW